MILNECVYGVVEVKTKLNGNELVDACEKISKVKKLPKIAYYPDPPMMRRTRTVYGKTYPYTPTTGMIFAFDSIDLETLGNHFTEWCKDRAPEERPDSIWILGKGYFVWNDPANGFINPTPEPGASLFAMEPWVDEDILLPLALHLNILFGTAWMPALKLVDYAKLHPLGVLKQRWHDAEDPLPK